MDASEITQTLLADWAEKPIPGSYEDLYTHYGDPRNEDFEDRYIVGLKHLIANGQVVTVRSHIAIVSRLHNVWARLTSEGQLGLLHSYDGCFVERDIRGASNPSVHSWGLAIDINAALCPLGSSKSQAPEIIQAFNEQGFFWGGDFYQRNDPMHFQYTRPHTI